MPTTSSTSRVTSPSQLPNLEIAAFWSWHDGSREPYRLSLPSGGVRPDGLAIYLHGHGFDLEQGWQTENFEGSFARLRAELDSRALAFATLNYRGKSSWMNPAAEADIEQLIVCLEAYLGVKRVLLIGASMGGTSALAYAVRHPEQVLGVIALCPAADIAEFYNWSRAQEGQISRDLAEAIELSYDGTPEERPELYTGRSCLSQPSIVAPVVLVHGAKDKTIPVEHSRRVYEARQRAGVPVLYVELPEGDHDAPVISADWGAFLDFVLVRTISTLTVHCRGAAPRPPFP